MTKCEKCGSKNLDYRSNYEWGEEYNEDNEDNIIQCDDCNNEWETNDQLKFLLFSHGFIFNDSINNNNITRGINE